MIVESLSRASRSIRDLFNFVHELEQRGIALISLKEQIDTTTAMGRAFLGVIAVLNQFESDVASERAAMNIEFLRHGKGRHWGTIPYGCVRAPDDHRLLPTTEGIWWLPNGQMILGHKDTPPFKDGTDAEWRGYLEALRRGYELYLENRTGYIKISRQLNAEGFRYRSRQGLPRPFDKDAIRRMIAAFPIYAGNVVIGRAKDNVTDYVKGSHSAILPADLTEQAAALRKKRRAHWGEGGGGRPKHVYLFQHLYCADCGSRMTGHFERGRRWYRHNDPTVECSTLRRLIPAEEVEAGLWVHLDGFRSPEEMKQRIREKALRLMQSADVKGLQAAQRELRRLEQGIDRLRELYVEGEISKGEYSRRRDRLLANMTAAEAKMQRLAPDIEQLEQSLKRLDRLVEVIQAGAPAQQREAIDALLERIEEGNGVVVRAVLRTWARELISLSGV